MKPECAPVVNNLSVYYHQFLKKNNQEIKRIVEENPEFALRIFSIFGDKKLGTAFVERYTGDEGYRRDAAFVAREIRAMAPRAKRPYKIELEDLIVDNFPRPSWIVTDPEILEEQERGVHVAGNNHPVGNYWMEN